MVAIVSRSKWFSIWRPLKKGDVDSIAEEIPYELLCNICRKDFPSRAEFASHQRSYENRHSYANCVNVLPKRLEGYPAGFVIKLASLAPSRNDTWECTRSDPPKIYAGVRLVCKVICGPMTTQLNAEVMVFFCKKKVAVIYFDSQR